MNALTPHLNFLGIITAIAGFIASISTANLEGLPPAIVGLIHALGPIATLLVAAHVHLNSGGKPGLDTAGLVESIISGLLTKLTQPAAPVVPAPTPAPAPAAAPTTLGHGLIVQEVLAALRAEMAASPAALTPAATVTTPTVPV